MRAILIETDGLDITCTEFSTTEKASEEMKKRYKRKIPKQGLQDCYAGLSYINGSEARLINCDEAYIWKIHEVHKL